MIALPPHTGPLGQIWFFFWRVIAACILLFLALPIFVVLPLSFSSEIYFSYPMPGWSFRWYQELWTNPRWYNAAVNSFAIGTAAAFLAVLLGTLAALGLSRQDLPGRKVIVALILAPLIVPTVITSVGIFFFYSQLNLVGTFVGIIVAHTVIAVPFVVILVLATLAVFDTNLIRAAAGLGANPVQVFRRVTMPLIAPGLFSAAILAFVTSFDEVVIVLFLGGPELRTLPREMWKTVREQTDPTILAVSTVLVGFTLVLFGIAEWLRRRDERVRGSVS